MLFLHILEVKMRYDPIN